MMPAQWFNWTWSQLAQFGLCDAPGSVEYVRVIREWKAAGYPELLITFILQRANKPCPQ